jgi:hypothetical protein
LASVSSATISESSRTPSNATSSESWTCRTCARSPPLAAVAGSLRRATSKPLPQPVTANTRSTRPAFIDARLTASGAVALADGDRLSSVIFHR